MMDENQKLNNYPSPVEAWSTVAVLSLTYMFSYMDRQILVLLVEPIKVDLRITDTQVSLLTGLSFALVYAFACIPMGRAADLWVRKNVIIGGVIVWSVLTMICGFARNFWQLFFFRMGVGFGEAALTPTAYSMIADLFPPDRLAKALSVFGLTGLVLGSAIPLVIGGLIIGLLESFPSLTLPIVGTLRTWQLVLVVAGALSLLMVIPLSVVKEPKRHQMAESTLDKSYSFKEVLDYLWRERRVYVPFMASAGLAALALSGYFIWLPSYFIRVHGWSADYAGITLGSLSILPSILGGILAGWLSDHFHSKGFHHFIVYFSIGSLVLTAIIIPAIFFTHSMPLKIAILNLAYFISIGYFILSPVMLQLLAPNQIRAQVSGIYLLSVNLIGLGLGSPAVALTTDFIFQNENAVGYSIAIVTMVGMGLAAVLLSRVIKPFKQQSDAFSQPALVEGA